MAGSALVQRPPPTTPCLAPLKGALLMQEVKRSGGWLWRRYASVLVLSLRLYRPSTPPHGLTRGFHGYALRSCVHPPIKERLSTLTSAQRLRAVSYTHLTLPTTERV